MDMRIFARGASGVALAIALSTPCASWAAETGPEAESADASGIQDIVVTARKRSEAAQTVPLAITAVGEEELATRGVTQVADVKALVPSISMQSDSYTNFGVKMGIRGQQTTDTLLQSQGSVGIYMDGVYVANSAGLLLSNMADVRQMDVLKGPQGTLFGRNTTGGALVISTNLPSYEKISDDFKIGVGNFGRMELSNTINLPLASNAALRVTGQFYNNDGYGKISVGNKTGPVSAPRDAADQRAYNVRATLMVDPTENLNIVLRGDYSHGESHGRLQKLAYSNPAAATALATLVGLGLWNAPSAAAPSGTPNMTALTNAGLTPATAFPYAANLLMAQQPADPYTMVGSVYTLGKIKEYGTSATLTYNLSDNVSIKSISAYRHMGYNTGQDSDSTTFDFLDTPVMQQKLDVFSQELTLNGQALASALNWTLGAYYFHQVGEDNQIVNPLAYINPREITTNGKFTQETYAFYGQASYSLTEALRITAGLRYTHEKQVLFNKSSTRLLLPAPFNIGTCDSGGTYPNCGANLPAQQASNVSYTASLDYKITPDVMLYVRTSRGFKGGGTNERGGSLVGRAFKPEVVTDYEVGLKSYLLDRKVRFNLAIYQSNYTNIQRTVIVPDGQSGVTSIINNAGKARIRGVEADLLVQPVDGLSLSFSAAYTDPKYLQYLSNGVDLSGNSFQAVAKWSWNAAASYAIPVGENTLRPSVDYSYQSEVNFQSDSNTNTATVKTAQYTTQKGYGLLNGRIAFEFDQGSASVSIWGKNLTNKYYLINALDVAQSLGIVTQGIAAPRSYGVQFTKSF